MNRHITQEKEKIVEEDIKGNWTHYKTLWHTRCDCLKITVYVFNFYTLLPIFQV